MELNYLSSSSTWHNLVKSAVTSSFKALNRRGRTGPKLSREQRWCPASAWRTNEFSSCATSYD